jgi:5'-nucleotidase (lipoprotein e(P4) family)
MIYLQKLSRRGCVVAAITCALPYMIGCATKAPERLVDQSTQAALWTQNAGEYQALCYQTFNLAKLAVDRAKGTETGPWAVVVDLDETMLDNSPYAAWRLLHGKPFEPATWDAWCRAELTPSMPGSLDFARHVISQGGALFYVSNRSDATYEATRSNLIELGFPEVNDLRLLLKSDTSNKQPRFQAIADSGYSIVLMLGDNLNDFPELETWHKGNAERNATLAEHQSDFGDRFIVFPNPSYGDWEGGLVSGYHKLTAEEKLAVRREKLCAWSGE